MAAETPETSGSKVNRRSALALGGGLLALSTLAKTALMPEAVKAQQARLSKLTDKQWAGTPWVAPKMGDFDLMDVAENRLATMKVSNNLVGEKTYIPMITRATLGQQGKAGAVFYGHVGLWKWQLQEVDPAEFPDAPEGTFVQRAEYTGIVLHPHTYEPVETVYNEILDQHVKVEDSLFGESYLFYPKGGGESVDRDGFMNDDPDSFVDLRPMARFGDDIVMFLDGIFKNEGPHQPRMDTSAWTMDYHDLMDPDRQLREVDYNFAGLLFAGERGWTGHSYDDKVQLLWNVKGTKMHDPERMPEIILRNIAEKYPDRM